NVAADFLFVIQANFVHYNDEYTLDSVAYRYLNVVLEKELISSVKSTNEIYTSPDLFQACVNFGAELAHSCGF
ncbi:MAG: hypothetical protein JW874_16265, partial [Spirochaetales bacterium]|nr:hypothetical protein [Spirochaetales bacterium]